MQSHRFQSLALIGLIAMLGCVHEPTGVQPPELVTGEFLTVPVFTPVMAAVGRAIFFDETLSLNGNQSCAACHESEWGFTGPVPAINAHGAVYEGSVAGRFGDRKPPSSAYATPSPVFHFDFDDELYFGGNFWDGRATGLRLGSAAAEQAQGPFLNPVEQALRDEACVVYLVRSASYVAAYRNVFGTGIDNIQFPSNIAALCRIEGDRLALSPTVRTQVSIEYDNIAYAIAAFEDSDEVNAFSSKYDAYLAGTTTLTPQESSGLALFEGKAMCSACHPGQGSRALFTDFSFDNLGAPANPENPVYSVDKNFRDLGLGGFLKANRSLAVGGFAREFGKVKVPTLRNVDRRPYPGAIKAFLHNGVFKTLDEVVHFYNTRDELPTCGAKVSRTAWGVTCWPLPEVRQNMNTSELGRLRLTSAEEAAVVAFLRTLSDGWTGPTAR
jgi:cytochrome c peroxidase